MNPKPALSSLSATGLLAAAALLALTAPSSGQGISIFQADTAGEGITTTEFVHSFDNPVRTTTEHTLDGGTDIKMAAGHHLVIYNSRFDSTGGSNRSEIQTNLNLAGTDLSAGWSQGYIRRTSGQDETITAGGAIIDVATTDDVLQLQSFRTDSNTGASAIREPAHTGIQLIKLDDGWDYLRLNATGTTQTIPNDTSSNDVLYLVEEEKDTVSFEYVSGTGVTLKQQGHYLVFANTYATGNNDRMSLNQFLTLGGTEVTGSRTTAYLRGQSQNSCKDGAASIGMIIETTAPNQLLNVVIQQEDQEANMSVVGDRTGLTIVKLPDTGDYIRLADTSGDQNVNSAITLVYDDAASQLELDSGFTHSTTTDPSRVAAVATGDFLFFASQYDSNDGVQRGFYNQGWQANGTGGIAAYGQTGRYSRSSGVDTFGNWSGFITTLNGAEYVETLSQPLGAGGTNTADTLALQGVRLDNLFGPDGTPPEIASTVPADGATDVYIGTPLAATFNELVDLTGSGTITVSDGSDTRVVQLDGVTADDGDASITGAVLTITLDANLNNNTTYEVTISGGAIQDQAGTPNAYPGTAAGEWDFTTPALDGVAPVISTTDPVDNATGVAPNQVLTATFDKVIVAASGDIRIVDVAGSTTLQTIAIADDTQVAIAGSTLTITPATLLPANLELEVEIDAGAVVNLSDIGFAGTTSGQWTFSTTDTTRFTTAAASAGNDTWNQAANWDIGTPPTGTLKAVINSALTATAEQTPATYSGGLTLETDANLTIRDGAGPLIALGTGPITMDGGNTLTLLNNAPDNIDITNDIALLGNLAISNSGNGTDNETRFLTGTLSGAGQLSYTMRRGNTLNIDGTNTSWSGGFVANCSDIISSNLPNGVEPGADGAFGTGDVTMNDAVRLLIPGGLTDTIGDSAALNLNGIGRDGFKLQLASNETIGQLWIDGIQYPSGTYSESGATDFVGQDWISGSGVLTVTTGPTDGIAPTVASIGDDKPGGQVFVNHSVTYTVTFSDPMFASTIELGDFETSGTATTTVDSVTQVALDVYEVLVSATSTGTMRLQIKAGANLLDFGNDALDTTSAVPDDTEIEVIPFATNNGSLALDFQETVASEEFDAQDNTWGDTTPGRYYHISVNANNAGYASYIALDTSGTPIPPYTRSISGPVLGWSFIGGGTNGDLTVSEESGGLISWTTTDKTDPVSNTFDSFGQNQKKFWNATDPGPGFNLPADETAEGLTTEDRNLPGYRSFGQATATIDVSGIASGTVVIFYGAFSATPVVDAVLRDSSGLHPDIALADLHLNGDTAQRTEFYAAEVLFETDGIYDTIVHNYLQPGGEPDGSGNGRSGGIVVFGSIAPASPYDTWAAAEGLSGPDALPTANPDSDPFDNLLEFAFGTDPEVSSPAELTVLSGTSFTPGGPRVSVTYNPLKITLRYVQHVDPAAQGLVYTPEFRNSTDTDFAADPANPTPTDVTNPPVNGYKVVEVPFLIFDSFGMKAGSEMGRVSVEQTP